jgi:hypothetical protein
MSAVTEPDLLPINNGTEFVLARFISRRGAAQASIPSFIVKTGR